MLRVQGQDFISEFENNYEVEEYLGTGAFGTVYKCKQIRFLSAKEDERVVAVKLVEFNANEKAAVIKEIELLRILNHPNIIKIFKSWIESPPNASKQYCYPNRLLHKDSEGAIFIETEFCKLRSLRDWFRQVWRRKKHAKVILYQIASGLEYLHGKKIIHRDLKPENILMTYETSQNYVIAKICDFGISREIRAAMTAGVGTRGYRSPEVEKKGSDLTEYDEKADVYSLGVIFFEMLVLGDAKNAALSCKLDLMRHSENTYKSELAQYEHLIDNQDKSLIQCMVQTMAANRPNAKEILQTLLTNYPQIKNMTISTARVSAQNPTPNLLQQEVENVAAASANKYSQNATPKNYFSTNQSAIKRNPKLNNEINNSDTDKADMNDSKSFQTIKAKWQRMSLNETITTALSPNKTNQNTISRRDNKSAKHIEKETVFEKKGKNYWEETFLSFEVHCKNENVRKTLYIISFLHPNDIHTAFAIHLLKKLSSFDEKSFDTLEEHCMCQKRQIDDKFLVPVDPILQIVVRTKLEKDGKLLQTLDEILDITYKMLIADELKWSDLNHIETVWKHAAKITRLVVKHTELPDRIAELFELAGKYRNGSDFCCGSLEDLKCHLEIKHRSTLRIMFWKGVFHRCLQEYEMSLKIQPEVYQNQKSLFGEEDNHTLDTAREIGWLYCLKRDCERAKKWSVETLQIREGVNGKEHNTTLLVKNDLAIVLKDLGKYEEAEEMLKEILAVREKVYGREHRETLTTKQNIAYGKEEQGKYEEALKIFEEVLELREKVLGKEHPDILNTKIDVERILIKIFSKTRWSVERIRKRGKNL